MRSAGGRAITRARAGARSCTALLIGALAAVPATASAAPFAYITNQGSHDVSVIDLAVPKVVATVPVGRAPAGVVAASRTGKVYVSNPDSKSISVIDMRTQRVVGTLPAGSGPVGIDASPDGSRLYVADWYANQLLAFDTTRPSSNNNIDTAATTDGTALPPIAVGRAPAGVAVDATGATVYVAERDDDSVAAIDVATGRVRARVRVGTHPFALLFDAPRERLYALNVLSDDLSVIDTRAGRGLAVIATVPVGKAPYGAALAHAGALLYVTNQHDDSVSVVDAERLATVRTLPGFGYPEGVAAHADRVYVVNWMDDDVSVLDAASGRQITRIATGRNSRGFGAFIGAPATP